MKTRMNQNSLEAYDQIKDNLSPKRGMVFNEIEYSISMFDKPLSALQIKDRLRWQINQVTGRINELLYDCQMIKIVGATKINGRTHNTYGIRQYTDPLNIRKRTKAERIEDYIIAEHKELDNQLDNSSNFREMVEAKAKRALCVKFKIMISNLK